MSRTDTAIRVISAPPDRVYAALTDPDALAVWLPPDGMTGRFEHFDARPGGSYRLALTYAAASAARGKSAADSDVIDARFVEIVPGMRVVQQIEFVSEGPRRSHEFTLAGCSATVAVKVLWILQERDRCSFGISILRMRNLLKSARDAATLFEVLFEVAPSNEHVAKLLRMTLSLLRQQRALLEGIDPTESDRWGPDVLERFPSVHGTRSRNIVIDWSAVGCGWLRRLGKTWALETLPHYEKLRPMLSDYPQLWELQTILAFCRSAGHMGDVPGAFVLTTSHLKSRPTDRRRDDDPGKALPDQVVDILDRNLKSAAACDDRAIPLQDWSNDDYGLMLQSSRASSPK